MCSVTSERRAKCGCEIDRGASLESADFYAALLDGMHALAQPITVLHSCFYLAQPEDPGQRQLIAAGATAVEQLCTLFRLMRELVHAQSEAAQASVVPLSHLIALLEEDAEVVFAGTGLWLEVRSDLQFGRRLPEHGPAEVMTVCVDADRTRHAIQSMLHIARQCSQQHSAVSCILSNDGSWLSLSLAPQTPVLAAPENCFDEQTRLHLALAKANLVGQQAVFSLASEPFALSIRMTIANIPGEPVHRLISLVNAGTLK